MRESKNIIINGKTLEKILENHKHWLNRDIAGWRNMRANLNNADLRYADLSNANLRYVDLSNANLNGANLRGANLKYADLNGADLNGADLRYAVK